MPRPTLRSTNIRGLTLAGWKNVSPLLVSAWQLALPLLFTQCVSVLSATVLPCRFESGILSTMCVQYIYIYYTYRHVPKINEFSIHIMPRHSI